MRKRLVRLLLAGAMATGLLLVPGTTANAASWTYLSLQSALQPHYEWARVCKTAQTGGFGPVWRYTFQMQKRNPYQPASIAADVLRDNSYWLQPRPAAYNDQWIYGVVSGFDVYGSRLFDDQVQFRASDPWNPRS